LSLRENEEGLSIYAVADDSVGQMQQVTADIGHYFSLTLGGCNNCDFLLIPDGAWNALELRPEQIDYNCLHPYLRNLHYEIRGLTPALAVQLAANVLADPTRQAGRLRKSQILEAAPGYLQNDPNLRGFLHHEWVVKLLAPEGP
jgi:hypothetical protein